MSSVMPLAEFELRGGGRLRLYSNRLVHKGRGALVEIMPYAHLASVRVAYERDRRKLQWAIGLLIAAFVLSALSGPMQGWFTMLANWGSGDSAHSEVLAAVFNALIAFARFLPRIALVLGLIAIGLSVSFAIGRTTFTLHFAATQRAFGTLGRNRRLIEFAERPK
jgi:ABC-type amino acid transport system permease subunit